MASNAINSKSQKVQARAPHEVVNAMDSVKEDGETTGQFIVTAMQGEIKRRQRKKAKEAPEG
ncbi:YlcI/YnfO family protein [Rahnella sp. ChDrAdgB13]|uniref:YlcI/YnfO family protein n=1 Tax=Rahnella sp. ChDrAdgB13 TaxID=1850581 RepID=UPI001FCBF9CF|nr:YlcI/YnfO family protein [Rahnella sp. ChDrAdgB13]